MKKFHGIIIIIIITKTMCGADCWTDHKLVVSKLNLRIQPARRLDAINLSSENPEENWTVFHKTVHSTAATTGGHPSRKHQKVQVGEDQEKAQSEKDSYSKNQGG